MLSSVDQPQEEHAGKDLKFSYWYVDSLLQMFKIITAAAGGKAPWCGFGDATRNSYAACACSGRATPTSCFMPVLERHRVGMWSRAQLGVYFQKHSHSDIMSTKLPD